MADAGLYDRRLLEKDRKVTTLGRQITWSRCDRHVAALAQLLETEHCRTGIFPPTHHTS